jgi:transcriptional regulator with XRE-family HTH domain
MADTDPVMEAVRKAFDKSGLTMAELGRRMGYEGEAAKKSAWQFLTKTSDPRISMLRRFAKAIGVKVSKLLED